MRQSRLPRNLSRIEDLHMLSAYPLRVVEKAGQRYLVNDSALAVRRLVFCTGCRFIDYDGTVIESPAPRYELRDIPAACHVRFEESDPEEGGILWWQAEEVHWEDGQCDRGIDLHEHAAEEEGPLPGTIVAVARVALEMTSA